MEECRGQYAQAQAQRDRLEQEAAEKGAQLRRLMAEKEDLGKRVAELSGQSENVRREKEKLAQLELDAHHRADALMEQTREEADSILAQARSQADSLIAAADEQAASTVAQAEARRNGLLKETEEQVAVSVRQCGELFDSCEKITGHIASELRKLDVANAQLPIGLAHLKAQLGELLEQAGQC